MNNRSKPTAPKNIISITKKVQKNDEVPLDEDQRLDMFADFFLDRILEKIQMDNHVENNQKYNYS